MASMAQDHAFGAPIWDPLVSAYLGAALGVDKCRQIQAAIAVPPLTTCLRVNTLRTTTQDVLQQLKHDLPQHSSSFAPHPDLPVAILLKGSGPNDIDPAAAQVTKEVVIGRKAGEAVLRGAQVFVPGVLACSAGLAEGDLVVVTAALDMPGTSKSGITRGTVLPATHQGSINSSSRQHLPAADGASSVQQKSANTTARVGQPAQVANVATADSYTQLAAHSLSPSKETSQQTLKSGTVQPANGAAAPTAAVTAGSLAASGGWLFVGIGRAAMGRTEMFRASHGVAVEMVQRVYDVPSPPIDGQLKGSVMLQNLPSIVAAQVLNPRPGSRVLDMCAAPGGKTTMLAQIMGGVGEIIALDRSHGKVDDIKALAAELGCSNCVHAYKADSTKAVITPEQQLLLQREQCRDQQEQQPLQERQPQQQMYKQQKQQGGRRAHQQLGKAQQQQQQQQQVNGHHLLHTQPVPQQLPAPPLPPHHQQQQQHARGLSVQHQRQPLQEQQPQQQHSTQQLQLQPAPPPPRLQQQQQWPQQQHQQQPRHELQQVQPLQKQETQTSSRKLLLLLQEAEKLQQHQVVLPADSSGLSAKAVARMQRRLAAMVVRGQPAAPAIQAEYRYYGFGPAKCPGFPPESFDYILLDAPCTALGLRPRLQQQHTLGLLLETAAYQRALMYVAVQLLKPGGHLVFSTCTISPAENEVNVRHLLDSYPCLKLVPAEPRIGGPGLTGPADVQALRAAVTAAAQAAAGGKRKQTAAFGADKCNSTSATPSVGSKWGGVDAWCSEQWLTPEEANMVQRVDPSGPEDTIGFFIAKFEKVRSC